MGIIRVNKMYRDRVETNIVEDDVLREEESYSEYSDSDYGVQGAQGPIGPKGAQGPAGAQGVQGTQGKIGPQGFVGCIGMQGRKGAQGPNGARGERGAMGAQGLIGENGAQGRKGQDGLQGARGKAGAQGAQGFIGENGAQGRTGAQGIQGFIGHTGPMGAQGRIGTQGIQGHRGTRGCKGIQGPRGYIGLQGDDGPVGFRGPVGEEGGIWVDGIKLGGYNTHLFVFKNGKFVPNSDGDKLRIKDGASILLKLTVEAFDSIAEDNRIYVEGLVNGDTVLTEYEAYYNDEFLLTEKLTKENDCDNIIGLTYYAGSWYYNGGAIRDNIESLSISDILVVNNDSDSPRYYIFDFTYRKIVETDEDEKSYCVEPGKKDIMIATSNGNIHGTSLPETDDSYVDKVEIEPNDEGNMVLKLGYNDNKSPIAVGMPMFDNYDCGKYSPSGTL